MYGRGNYAPQFGQGLQRPMPPFQQPPAGHPAPLQFQPGQPFPMQSVIQQGGMPHGGPPRGPGYLHLPPAPLNTNQSFVQRPPVQGGPPARFPYPGSQQNFPPGAQNPPPSIGPPGSLPPPPLQRPAGYRILGPRSTPSTQQGVHHIPLPPPPQAPAGFSTLPTFAPAMQQWSAGSHMLLPPQPIPPPPSSLPMVPNPPSTPLAGGESPSTQIHVAGGSPITHGDITSQKQILESESIAEVKTDSGREGSLISHTDMSMKESAPLELSSPPPKPADETVLRNIEVLCQFISKNGSQFEEMACKNEIGNPNFSFLVGGEPGSEASCARTYYLWMKKKYGLLNDSDNSQEKNLSVSHADVNVAIVHSPADSDVDMEDDITHTDKEPEVYNSVEDLKSGPVSTGEVLEIQKYETMVPYASDRSPALKSNPPVKSEEEAETKPEDSSGQLCSTDGSFRLIQNYVSDDNSEDELPHEQGEDQAVSPPPKSAFPTLYDDKKSGTTFEPGFVQPVTACVDNMLIEQDALAVQSESLETLTKSGSSEKHESDDRYDGDEPSNLNPTFQGRYAVENRGIDTAASKDIEALAVQTESQGTSTKGGSLRKHEIDDKFDGDDSNLNPTIQGRYAMESSGVNTTASKDIERKDKKSTSAALKVDEFGRLAKEGASDSESDDTQHVRHRGRRDRSRSRSRSPSDRKRRRSPRRRKGRRSRSRSWSPKRRRSRSRSPHRSGGDFGGENLRRGKAQTQECFDFIKGRCYRGASCRYLHHEMGKSESSRRNKGKQCPENVASAKSSEFGDGVTSSLPLEDDDIKGEKIPYHSNKHDDDLTSKTNDGSCKVESKIDGVPNVLHEDVQNLPADFKNSEGHREDATHVQGASEVHMHMPHLPISLEHPLFEMPSTTQSIHHSLAEIPQKCDGDNLTMVSSGKINSSVATSVTSPSGINAPPQPKELVEFNSITPVSFPSQTVPFHAVPPYHAPLSGQKSQHPDPANSEWSVLPSPQPHPPHVIDSFISGVPFQQGDIRMRNEFPNHMSLRAQSGELAGQSQSGGFQYQTYHLPSSNVSSTPFAGPSVVRDDRVSHFPSHNHGPSGSFTPGVPPKFAGDSKGSQSVHGYASEPLVREQASRVVSAGGSGITAHYNPYASTFDQPLSSRFSSAFAQERVSSSGIKYDSSFSLSRGPNEGQAGSGYGSRQILSSPNSSRAEERMPRLGGVQYDPLFDSIEPSSKRVLKEDQAADNSDMLKVGSHKTLDVADNKKQKEVGAVVAATSLENDEYGETADAEVGAVENGSLSDSDDDAIIAEGEIEIDQIKGGGKDKTSKDSRSMKLFKVAVANFVKEVLKPQWRQGNMSKEVFKTIVKKTVDKVSGAMKTHRLPKSQAKIDHYIDSSRRKLTQLVEGYVSKYKS
ncbi:hypothetical protein RND81_10G211900 [Saponaria officinalis]|uniref:C3H1-type domain-containing protein n=3 Tax=Saponaria officinalis TaxID=3572 RepID=A0AAW1I651_SAPOF